jgi:hypothetical protein
MLSCVRGFNLVLLMQKRDKQDCVFVARKRLAEFGKAWLEWCMDG